MDKIDYADFLAWRHHRITDLFMAHLVEYRKVNEEALLADMSDDPSFLKKQVAILNTLDTVIKTSFEDLTGESE